MAADHTSIFQRSNKGNKRTKLPNRLAKMKKTLGRSAKISGLGVIISSTRCGTRSIEGNAKFDQFLSGLNNIMVDIMSLIAEDKFNEPDFLSLTEKRSDFCSTLENLMETILVYSRNTAWQCRSNGHTSSIDVCFTGGFAIK